MGNFRFSKGGKASVSGLSGSCPIQAELAVLPIGAKKLGGVDWLVSIRSQEKAATAVLDQGIPKFFIFSGTQSLQTCLLLLG